MAYTSADLASVQTAILALASGTRVTSVSVGGKTIEYHRADLNKLETLRNSILSDVNRNKTNCILIKTSKGL